MLLFASMTTAISLSFAQEGITTDNSQVEKAAKVLLFGAEDCEHLAGVYPFVAEVVGIDGSHTMKQLEFILNYEKEGKTPLAIAQSKGCETCDELAELLGKYTTAIEAAKLLEISHLTGLQIQDNSDMKFKMDTIMDMINAKNAQK